MSDSRPKPLRAAIVQTSPVFMHRQESLDKALAMLAEAAGRGAQLVAFPETWLPGYPVWIDHAPTAALWDHAPARALFRRLHAQSVGLRGKDDDGTLALLRKAARQHRCAVVMGLNERSGSTLYNTMLFVGADGETVRIHRKLVPTYTERMMWGRGDGSMLEALPTPFGPIGGLICWEHWMPLARAAMHRQHELVHVAQWPTVHDLHQLASRHYAFEGGCHVLAVGTMLSRHEVLAGYALLGEDEGMELLQSMPAEPALLQRGGSAIISPRADYIVEPVFERDEILIADLDLELSREASLTLDTDGHYSRPDVFELRVDTRPQPGVRFDPGA